MSSPLSRILTAVVLIPLLWLVIFLGPLFTGILLALAAVLGSRELARFHRGVGLPFPLGISAGGAVLLVGSHGGFLPIPLPAALTLVALAALVVPLVRRDRKILSALSAGAFFPIYLGLLPAHLLDFYQLGGEPPNPWPVLFALLLVWGSDTGAYLVGSLLGRHKLWPAVSPGKTWEGGAAGLLVPVALALALGSWIPGASPIARIVAGLLVGLLAQIGDLGESWMKRAASEKESGSLLPGHGGILDRLDSMIFSIPVLYYWLRWSVLVS